VNTKHIVILPDPKTFQIPFPHTDKYELEFIYGTETDEGLSKILVA